MNYLLVHGSWHGAWAFGNLIPFLEEKGHRVFCSDLPGSGDDAANAVHVTFTDLYEHVCELIRLTPEPMVVVAHSFAGLLVARACEEQHARIHHIFFVGAWLPQEGMSLVDKAIAYDNSELHAIFVDCGDRRLRALHPQGAKHFFYHDCSDELQEWAVKQLRPKAVQPDNEIMPAFSPVHTLIKSSYIICDIDRVINPESQLDMAERYGIFPDQIKVIEAGHAPFLSKPKELAELLTEF